MTDATKAVQKAIHQELSAVLPVPVYDYVPPDAGNKYVTMGSHTVVDASAKDVDGQELTIEVHQWDSTHRGRMGVLDMQGRIYNALHDANLTVDGFGLTYIWFEFSTSFLDEDGLTMHGVLRFRVRTLG
jgi:Protein of unknown function (DUF3168)